MTEFFIAAVVTIIMLYAWGCMMDFAFGVRMRRRNSIKGLGWSRWANMGWDSEDRRRKGLQ